MLVAIWRNGHVTGPKWTATPAQIASKRERRRERLETDATIWSPESLWWRRVLFDFSVGEKIERRALDDAAAAAYVEHQAYLRPRERDHLDSSDFFQVTATLRWATAAMSRDRSKGQAKALQLKLARAKPLTVCAGTTKWFPKMMAETWVPGCRIVFEDTTRCAGGRHSYWLRWCPDHVSRKHPERTLLPKHVRQRAGI